MVHVSDYGFYIDKYEVTNRQYAEFVKATGHRVPEVDSPVDKDTWNTWVGTAAPSGYEHHPVINVSWDDAKAYCEWVGKRLPTDIEWQQACQGTGGLEYPWGSSFVEGNTNSEGSGDGFEKTSPVGSFPGRDSPYGAMDMSGNVWEWTSTKEVGLGAIFGGSWSSRAKNARCGISYGYNPANRSSSVGFRCAK